MRKVLMITFLVVVAVNEIIYAADAPTDKVDAEDYLDPDLPKVDKKIWKNILKYYGSARQIASATLEEMGCIQDFCWSSYRYLNAIERAANRAKVVYEDVKNFLPENPFDELLNQVEEFEDGVSKKVGEIENSVSKKTEELFDWNNIPNIKSAREDIKKAREQITERTKGSMDRIKDLYVDKQKFKNTVQKLVDANMPDMQILTDADPDDADLNFHTSILSQAVNQIALTGVADEFADNQTAQLAATIKNAANDGTSDPLHQSEMTKVDERNTYLLSLQENTYLSENIKTSSFFLLMQAKGHADRLAAKKAMFCTMEPFTEAMEQKASEVDK